jgi:hypothetical protein
MTDEKNAAAAAQDAPEAQDALETERVEELFATKPYEQAAEAAAAEGLGAASAAPATSATSATLPDAEPAWLQNWGKSQRTTPRIRWGGIVWGLVFAATGWFALWTMLAEERRAQFSDWILSLDNGGWAVVAACAIGGLMLVIGLNSGLRAATRKA